MYLWAGYRCLEDFHVSLLESPLSDNCFQTLTSDRSSFMQEGFLADLRALNPDVCITAAYGNFLPSKFLAIPTYGRFSFLRTLEMLHSKSICICHLETFRGRYSLCFLATWAACCSVCDFLLMLLSALCSDIGCYVKLTALCSNLVVIYLQGQ